MYLNDHPQHLDGFFKKLTAPLRKAAAPILKVQAKVQNVVERKFVPESLKSITQKAGASALRVTQAHLVPTDVPKLVKQEVAQVRQAAKDGDLKKIAAAFVAAAAIYFTGGAAAPAVMQLIKAQADKKAAQKAAAKTEAEAAAIDAEWNDYLKALAAEQNAKMTANVAPTVSAATPSPSIAPSLPAPVTAGGSMSVMRSTLQPSRMRTTDERAPASVSDSPNWLMPAVLGGGAILAALLFTGRRARR